MKKYKVILTLEETYELFIEADNEDAAIELANDTDIDLFDNTGTITQSLSAREVEPITEEDNI